MRFTAAFASALALAAGANAAVSASDMKMNIDQITDVSSQTNDVAKSISVTNFFQKTPEMVQGFKRIIEMVSKDITAMNNKRSLQARQECLDVTDVEKCLEDLGEIVEDPSEILGEKRSLQARQECLDEEEPENCLRDLNELFEDPGEILGQKRDIPDVGEIVKKPTQTLGRKRQDTGYSDLEQSQICDAFRGFVQVHQELLKTVIGKHGLLSLTPFTQPIAAVLRTLEGGVDTIAFGIIDTVPTCAEGATNDKNSLDSTLTDARDKYES